MNFMIFIKCFAVWMICMITLISMPAYIMGIICLSVKLEWKDWIMFTIGFLPFPFYIWGMINLFGIIIPYANSLG